MQNSRALSSGFLDAGKQACRREDIARVAEDVDDFFNCGNWNYYAILETDGKFDCSRDDVVSTSPRVAAADSEFANDSLPLPLAQQPSEHDTWQIDACASAQTKTYRQLQLHSCDKTC